MENSSINKPRAEKKKKSKESNWPRKSKVTLEGYIESIDHVNGGDLVSDTSSNSSSTVGRTKSLTDEDLEELKGCLDLGFGFNYDEIPELCNTLPALELCYSMSHRFLDEQKLVSDSASQDSTTSLSSSSSSTIVANWNFSSPGDNPDEVKARLKYWAQAVACTVRLCS